MEEKRRETKVEVKWWSRGGVEVVVEWRWDVEGKRSSGDFKLVVRRVVGVEGEVGGGGGVVVEAAMNTLAYI